MAAYASHTTNQNTNILIDKKPTPKTRLIYCFIEGFQASQPHRAFKKTRATHTKNLLFGKWRFRREKSQENGLKSRKSDRTRHKNKRGYNIEKWDQTDSPEIPDKGETSQIPGFPSSCVSVPVVCTPLCILIVSIVSYGSQDNKEVSLLGSKQR